MCHRRARSTRTVLVSVGVPVVGKLRTAQVVHRRKTSLPVVVRATCTFDSSQRGTVRTNTSRMLIGPVAMDTLQNYLDDCFPRVG